MRSTASTSILGPVAGKVLQILPYNKACYLIRGSAIKHKATARIRTISENQVYTHQSEKHGSGTTHMTAPSAKPTKQVQENSLENSAH